MTHITTIGVDFKIKTIPIDGVKIKMQIWDTAGQERFKTITQTYYKGAAGVVLVYAVNDRKTFNSLENWLKQINQSQPEHISKIIVGNKSDVADSERQVSRAEGEALAKKYGVQFLESSAKDNFCISEIFTELGQSIKKNLGESEAKPQKIKITDAAGNSAKKKDCEC